MGGSSNMKPKNCNGADGHSKPCLVYAMLALDGRPALFMAHDISDPHCLELALNRAKQFTSAVSGYRSPNILFESTAPDSPRSTAASTRCFCYGADVSVRPMTLACGATGERRVMLPNCWRPRTGLRNEIDGLLPAMGRGAACEASSNFVLVGSGDDTLTSLQGVTDKKISRAHHNTMASRRPHRPAPSVCCSMIACGQMALASAMA